MSQTKYTHARVYRLVVAADRAGEISDRLLNVGVYADTVKMGAQSKLIFIASDDQPFMTELAGMGVSHVEYIDPGLVNYELAKHDNIWVKTPTTLEPT